MSASNTSRRKVNRARKLPSSNTGVGLAVLILWASPSCSPCHFAQRDFVPGSAQVHEFCSRRTRSPLAANGLAMLHRSGVPNLFPNLNTLSRRCSQHCVKRDTVNASQMYSRYLAGYSCTEDIAAWTRPGQNIGYYTKTDTYRRCA